MASFPESIIGTAAPLPRDNVDAMMIAPRTPAEKGGAETQGGVETVQRADLFAHLRFPDGREDTKFVLNRPEFRDAKFLIAGRNFGCGSAREHAVWALRAFGIRGVIAPSFGVLFYGNCFKNQLVPIELPVADVEKLSQQCVPGGPAALVTLELSARTLVTPDGQQIIFALPEFRYRQLIDGLDEIDMTLQKKASIAAYRQRALADRPWLHVQRTHPTKQ